MSRFLRDATRQRSISRRDSHWKRSRLNIELLESRDLLSGSSATMDGIQQAFGQIPMSFEANQGQTDARVQYLARGSGYTLFLTGSEAVLNLRQPGDEGLSTSVRMSLVGANPNPQMEGLNGLPGKINHFRGSDPSQWETNISTFGKVLSHDVYPGIDVVYYGNQRQLEYDFLVAPGADPDIITMAFQGTDGIRIDAQGNLVLDTAGGDVIHHAPVIYQESATGRQAIAGHYVLHGANQVVFDVGAYDQNKPLVIDPVLGYSTYLGGSGDNDISRGIAVDSTGNAYISGYTSSTNFPTTPGASDTTYNGGIADAFVTKLDWSGSFLWYSTYIGGNFNDAAWGVAVDVFNNAYLMGVTDSANFPTTTSPPAFQPTKGVGKDAFVAKFDAFGALAYSSFLGGAGDDGGIGIAVDASGNAYLSGNTSGSFPTTIGPAYGGGLYDAFAARVDTITGAKVYARYLGGSGYDIGFGIAVNPTCSASCDAFVTGTADSVNFPTTAGAFQVAYGLGVYDGFVTKVNPTGAALVYSTYLGGGGEEQAFDIAVDAAGSAYVTGYTTSTTSASGYFPATPGAFQPAYSGNVDAFVTKLHWLGGVLDYSTYLGGSQEDHGQGIALDETGFAYVNGFTYSSVDFPITATNAFQKTFGGGQIDSFVTRVNPLGTALDYSTYLGGSADEGLYATIAVDQAGNAYVTGYTASTNFPRTALAFDTSFNGGANDAFVTRIDCCKLVSVTASPGPTTFLGTGLSPTVGTDGKPIMLANAAIDPHYTYKGPCGSGSGPTFAFNPAPAFWTPNGPSSQWLQPDCNPQPNGDYHFYMKFSLPSFCAAGIMGRWAADDQPYEILLNGLPTGASTNYGSPWWATFVITTGFKTGTNTLDFWVKNTGGQPVGLQVDMRGFYCKCGPVRPEKYPLFEFAAGMPAPDTDVPSFQPLDSSQMRGGPASERDDVNLTTFDPSQRRIRRLADGGSGVVKSAAIARERRYDLFSSKDDGITIPTVFDLATLNQ